MSSLLLWHWLKNYECPESKTIKHLHAAKDSLGQDSDPILSPDKEIQSVMMDFDGLLFGISQFALIDFNRYDILLTNMRLLVFGRTTI